MNEVFIEKIGTAQDILENRSTRAYKNKILKSQQGMKNPGEEVVFLIAEETYNKYTKSGSIVPDVVTPQNLLDEQSLLGTMNNYQKWIYLIFDKDIR